MMADDPKKRVLKSLAIVFAATTALQIVIQYFGQNGLASLRAAELRSKLSEAWVETVDVAFGAALHAERDSIYRTWREGGAETDALIGGVTVGATTRAAAMGSAEGYVVAQSDDDRPVLAARLSDDAFGAAPLSDLLTVIEVGGGWRFSLASPSGALLGGVAIPTSIGAFNEAVSTEVDGEAMVLVTLPVETYDGRPVASLIASRPDEERREALFEIELISYGIGAIWVFGACWFSYRSSRRRLAPLGDVAQGLEKMAHGDLSVSVDYQKDDEIGRIVDTFGTLRDQLERAEQIRGGEQERERVTQERQREDLLAMASDLEREIAQASGVARERAEGMSQAALQMSDTAAGAENQAERMTSAVGDTLEAVDEARSSADDLDKAAGEIEEQATAVRDAAHRAAADSREADGVVNRLEDASRRISEVVETIGMRRNPSSA